jgi:RimJ/RimL family protein N-acetyltransferase
LSFDLRPVLQSEQLLLRPLTVEDFDALFKVASDPLIWEQHPNSDRYKRDVFEKFFSDALARSHWGGPVNAEMKRLMLEHAFKYVKNVVFMIGPSNMRSRKAVEKIGAVHIGSRMRGGVESVVYRINQLPASCKV